MLIAVSFAYVVFLLSFAGLPEYATITYRVGDTLMGVALAFTAYLLSSLYWQEDQWTR